jgi:hypothetical protein
MERMPRNLVTHLSMTAMLVAIAGTALFYAMRRASPPRTSFYQPVYLKKFTPGYGDTNSSVHINFTNAKYATLFAKANRQACQNGVLKVGNA